MATLPPRLLHGYDRCVMNAIQAPGRWVYYTSAWTLGIVCTTVPSLGYGRLLLFPGRYVSYS